MRDEDEEEDITKEHEIVERETPDGRHVVKVHKRKKRFKRLEELGPDPDEYYLRTVQTLLIVFLVSSCFAALWFYYFFYH